MIICLMVRYHGHGTARPTMRSGRKPANKTPPRGLVRELEALNRTIQVTHGTDVAGPVGRSSFGQGELAIGKMDGLHTRSW